MDCGNRNETTQEKIDFYLSSERLNDEALCTSAAVQTLAMVWETRPDGTIFDPENTVDCYAHDCICWELHGCLKQPSLWHACANFAHYDQPIYGRHSQGRENATCLGSTASQTVFERPGTR